MTENVYDIDTRKKIERTVTPEGETQQQFMRRWSKTVKDGKFKSIALLVIDDSNYCTWGKIADSDLHQAIMALVIDDLKQELKYDIFGTDASYADEEKN
jgi:hypothetical protein